MGSCRSFAVLHSWIYSVSMLGRGKLLKTSDLHRSFRPALPSSLSLDIHVVWSGDFLWNAYGQHFTFMWSQSGKCGRAVEQQQRGTGTCEDQLSDPVHFLSPTFSLLPPGQCAVDYTSLSLVNSHVFCFHINFPDDCVCVSSSRPATR